MNTLYIKKSVIFEIYNMRNSGIRECGGIFGMNKNGVITHFCPDCFSKQSDRNEYRPSVEWLNKVIQKWFQEGINFCGIIHTHPQGYRELSDADKLYAIRILECNPGLDSIYFPIITGGRFSELIIWKIEKEECLITNVDYVVLDDKMIQ